MKNPLIVLALMICIIPASTLAFTGKEKILIKKNFYLLYLFEEEKVKIERHAAGIKFSQTDIDFIGDELVRLFPQKLILKLKTSGAYQSYTTDTAFIRKAWETDARGVNYVIDTYIEGRPPLYPKIDAMSIDTTFKQKLAASMKRILAKGNPSFYYLPLSMALEALRLNGRDEAARYEPLTGKKNAAAYKRVKTINWQQYEYSAILVPGLGPELPGVRLDPNGAKRCDSAAIRFRAGKAPFLIVSGGHVHPNKTPYCEAIEMKKYMVEVLHIPANAIIIEPHARHTTTNLRNANRLIYLFNMPAGKPVLIVTDAAQNSYINGNMGAKVIKELGYTPYASITKLNAFETSYLPTENSRHINSFDPLDP
jgi:hypothetical protein